MNKLLLVVPALTLFLILLATPAIPSPDTPDWEQTLNRVSRAVVSIQTDQTRNFDGEVRGSYQATGFVVDADRGILLTNRHVVGPGPTIAEALFLNQEEVELTPIYRDPVHDFGFYRFDANGLSFMSAEELVLAPEGAKVGVEIRIVGNDAGEKLSILAGTLARLDRPAPDYGRARYSDFNTFYIQAASGTSGGSSGSPVVDISGRVVALNAGARVQELSSFFLPLDRVARALELVRQGRPVPRGTIQTVFVRKPFSELQRLGLSPDTERRIRERHPGLNGLLVVEELLPGGPAEDLLELGDVLTTVDGRPVTDFTTLEVILDDSVGRTLPVEVLRSGTPVELRVEVQDLHAITPDSYLEIGRAVLNDLSYQQARSHQIPVKGVFVADPGFIFQRAGIEQGVVLTAIGDREVDSLDEAESVLAGLADGQRVPVRHFQLWRPSSERMAVVQIDRSWFPMQRCDRNDVEGTWDCALSPDPPPSPPGKPIDAIFAVEGDKKTRSLARSLVLVDFVVPYRIDAVHDVQFQGTGLVVDTQRGLVVTDRSVVPISMGDAKLTFAGSVEVPAEVVFVHPLRNLAVLSYDPSMIGETPVDAAEFKTEPLSIRDEVRTVVLTPDHQVPSGWGSIVTKIPLELPYPDPPRFRQANLEVLVPSTGWGFGGVLADGRGRIVALWSSFSYEENGENDVAFFGVPAEIVAETVNLVRSGAEPTVRTLGAELTYVPLAQARQLGLTAEWVARLEAKEGPQRALGVISVMPDCPAASKLRPGDLLLAVDDELVSSFHEAERTTAAQQIRLTILRDGEQIDQTVETLELSSRGTDRLLQFAGALIQEPHPSLARQRGIPTLGVYVSWYDSGTPASRYGLQAAKQIVEVDGVATPDLDAFIDAVADKKHRDSVRLRAVDLIGRESLITLKLDLHYWPTYEFRLTSDGWTRSILVRDSLRDRD